MFPHGTSRPLCLTMAGPLSYQELPCTKDGMANMLFCLSVCDTDNCVILDEEHHGDVLAVIEAKDWKVARGQAGLCTQLDPFSYPAGWRWMKRKESGML